LLFFLSSQKDTEKYILTFRVTRISDIEKKVLIVVYEIFASHAEIPMIILLLQGLLRVEAVAISMSVSIDFLRVVTYPELRAKKHLHDVIDHH
jgi:hypothetical protein